MPLYLPLVKKPTLTGAAKLRFGRIVSDIPVYISTLKKVDSARSTTVSHALFHCLEWRLSQLTLLHSNSWNHRAMIWVSRESSASARQALISTSGSPKNSPSSLQMLLMGSPKPRVKSPSPPPIQLPQLLDKGALFIDSSHFFPINGSEFSENDHYFS